MKRLYSYSLLLSGLMAQSYPVYALKCGSDLILEGDRKIEVLHKCGDPVTIDQRVEYEGLRLQEFNLQSRNQPHYIFDYEQHKPIYIEDWTYNFGPRRFMRLIRFENGVLDEITVLGYGYREED